MSMSATTGCSRSTRCSRCASDDEALSRSPARRLSAGRLFLVTPSRARISNARSSWAWTWSAASRISSAPWTTARRRVKALCEIAAERGLMVDMHCDETDDPLSRHIETLAAETMRHGLQGRVTGSHLTSMHSMDNYYVSKLIPLMRRGRAQRHRQSADQHHPAGPARHLSEAARHDAGAGADGGRRQRRLRP